MTDRETPKRGGRSSLFFWDTETATNQDVLEIKASGVKVWHRRAAVLEKDPRR